MHYSYDGPAVKNPPVAERPIHQPEQISFSDVLPNTAITVHNSADRLDRQRYVFAGYPYLNNDLHCLTVQVETLAPGGVEQIGTDIVKLADLGITPRPDGTWDQNHYSLVDYRWGVHEFELSESMAYAYHGYLFELPVARPRCMRDCCRHYPIEYIDISRPGYSPAQTVQLTELWQSALYIQVKQYDNRSILVRKMK